jgi:hypothetical protein
MRQRAMKEIRRYRGEEKDAEMTFRASRHRESIAINKVCRVRKRGDKRASACRAESSLATPADSRRMLSATQLTQNGRPSPTAETEIAVSSAGTRCRAWLRSARQTMRAPAIPRGNASPNRDVSREKSDAVWYGIEGRRREGSEAKRGALSEAALSRLRRRRFVIGVLS